MISTNEGEHYQRVDNLLRYQCLNMRSIPVTIKNRTGNPVTITAVSPSWGDIRPSAVYDVLPLTLPPGTSLSFCATNHNWYPTGCAFRVEAVFDTTHPVVMEAEYPLVGACSVRVTLASVSSPWGSDFALLDTPLSNCHLTLSGCIDSEEIVYGFELMIAPLGQDPHSLPTSHEANDEFRPERTVADKMMYKHLGLETNATQAEIEKAYKKMALKYHPDRNHGNPQDDMFKKVNEAYNILKDEKRRELYDAGGASSVDPNQELANTFSALFGGKAFHDLFGKTAIELEHTPRYQGAKKDLVRTDIRQDLNRLSRILHERILNHMANRPVFEHMFAQECLQKCGAPGGDTLLKCCGLSYQRALSLEAEGCGRCSAVCTTWQEDHEKTCSMIPALCTMHSARKTQTLEKASIEEAINSGQMTAAQGEEALRLVQQNFLTQAFGVVFSMGQLEIRETVQDVAKQTLYGFFAKSPRAVAERAVVAVRRMGDIMLEVGLRGVHKDHVSTLVQNLKNEVNTG